MSEPQDARNLVVCCDGTWNDPGNDAWGFYGDNRGYVTVTVEEIPATGDSR